MPTKQVKVKDKIDSPAPTTPKYILTVPIVATLLSKGKTQTEIAKTFNLTKQAVNQFIKNHDNELNALKNYDDNAINYLKNNVLNIQQSIDPETIKGANLQSRFTSTGIGIEKIRLLQDQSTSNIAYKDVSIEAQRIRDEIEALEKKM